MTIAPDKELEELDFPTPEITEEDVAPGPVEQAIYDAAADVLAVSPGTRIEVGAIRMTVAPTLDPPATTGPEFTEPDPEDIADALRDRLRQIQAGAEERWRTYGGRDWYCYCSPSRYARLAADGRRRSGDPYYGLAMDGGGGGRQARYEAIRAEDEAAQQRLRDDAMEARRLEAEYHDRLIRELSEVAPVTMRTWHMHDEGCQCPDCAPQPESGFSAAWAWVAGTAGLAACTLAGIAGAVVGGSTAFFVQ